MPHYKDGTPAKHCDLVLRRETHEGGTELVGIVTTIQKGSTSCNAQVIPLAQRQKGSTAWLPVVGGNGWCVTLSECEKIGDVVAAGSFDVTEHVNEALSKG